jgi:hypothetical protein
VIALSIGLAAMVAVGVPDASTVSVPLSEDHANLIVDFQLYGTVPVYAEDELSSRLADRTLRLRHAVVLAVRETSLKELADPRLTFLLQRIRQAANSALGGPELERVGFHELDYVAE